jgi:Do/DeqQ family serine protease
MQRLSTKKVLIFNLVLIGVLIGFSVAFLSFTCAAPGERNSARAQSASGPAEPAPVEALAAAESLQNAFRYVADKVLPSVVEIKTETVQKQRLPDFEGIPWEFFFGPRGQDRQRGQEREYRSQGLGSGIIVKQDGRVYYVLTNNHVVDGADSGKISVVSNDGKEYTAKIVGQDERRDLAMISFSTGDTFPVATLGNSDAIRVGDWAIAVGSPLGFMSSVTMGIVSAVGRTGGPGGNINDFIQTDASINQGNSGGALVNIKGEVIGINTWIASNNGSGSIGLGFAIPINNAKRSIDSFINKGEISYGWLGVSLTEPSTETAAALGLEGKKGALAVQVFMGSPAEKGGIRPGDFITHVDGKEARGVNQVTMMVGDLAPGQKAVFSVIRDGSSRNFTVTIEARTDEVAAENRKLWPGVQTTVITDGLRSRFKTGDSAAGVIVVQVMEGSPSAVIGMQEGDIITEINDKPVKDIAAFYKVLREETARELRFGFIRSGDELESLKFKR